MTTKVKVWFHRSRAGAWVMVGVLSFTFGWQNSVVLVWLASLYANIVSDWGAGEAADDRVVIEHLNRIERNQHSVSRWPRRLREQVRNR